MRGVSDPGREVKSTDTMREPRDETLAFQAAHVVDGGRARDAQVFGDFLQGTAGGDLEVGEESSLGRVGYGHPERFPWRLFQETGRRGQL